MNMREGGPQNRLYGRSREISLLWNALHRCCGVDTSPSDQSKEARGSSTPSVDTAALISSTPHVGLVLISGPRGVGKRALVENCAQATQSEALFLSGRFPQPIAPDSKQTHGPTCPRAIPPPPFRILQNALDRITQLVDSVTLKHLRTVVALSFVEQSSDREILTKLLSRSLVRDLLSPDHLVQPEASTSSLAPFGDATLPLQRHENEQCAALARFLFVVSTCLPILLHFQQIQWADADSLRVIQILFGTEWDDGRTKGLVILGNYCNDAEMNQETLEGFIRKVDTDASRHRVYRIPLDNVSRDCVEEWIRHTNLVPADETMGSFVDLVLDITAGNPLHVQYLLYCLQATDRIKVIGHDEFEILRRELPSEFDSLLSLLLAQLSRDILDLVETAAAIGECGSFDNNDLEVVLQRPCASDVAQLQTWGVLEQDGECVRFCRHELQTLAYSLIAESNRAAVHLKIGRRLWRSSSEAKHKVDESGRTLDLIAHQLFRGMPLVTDSEELSVIAVVHLHVGKQAMCATNVSSAVSYFEIARQALGDKLWSPERYDISLILHNCLAEALYCSGELEAMEDTLNAILGRARTFRDKLQAYTTFVFTNGARHRLKEAIAMALEVLKQLGEPISPNPGTLAVMIEYLRIRRLLRGKKDRYFISLPAATDTDKIAAMQMLNFAFYYSFVINPKIGAMAIFRMLRLTMLYGMTGPGSMALSAYGLLLNAFGRFEEGYRFGQIALRLLDLYDGKAWIPRIYFVVFGLINPNCRPLRESIEPLQFAHQAALNSGDIEGSVVAASAYLALAFHAGKSLVSLEKDTLSYCKSMESLSQTFGLIFILPLWHVLCSFSGTPELSIQLIGSVTEAESAREQATKEGNRTAISVYYEMQTFRCCYLGDFATALVMAEKSWEYTTEVDFHMIFYHGLAALALARATDVWNWQRRKRVSNGRDAAKKLRKWALICPANMRNKQYLLEAELAALKGDTVKALFLYDESIKAANQEGFVHEEGLAYERLAQFHSYLGRSQSVVPYFECARDVYQTWGAKLLVRRMETIIAELRLGD